MEFSHLHLFFGGSYSNIHALQSLKEEAEKLNIPAQNIYHTGDVVGYCAFPNETVNAVREWGINVIAGNVEVQLSEGKKSCGCNFEKGSRCADFSTRWYPYAQTQVSVANIDWMKTLKTYQVVEINGLRFGIIHGGLTDISQFIFESTDTAKKEEIIHQLNVDVVVAGHSGIPFMQQIKTKYWINPGVIGMPANDGTPRGWYAIYNAITNTFTLKSLNYDHIEASKEMIGKDLPTEYAKTLIDGFWDNCEILPNVETAQQGIKITGDTVAIRQKRTV
jgi:predicted phosphodiesterase